MSSPISRSRRGCARPREERAVGRHPVRAAASKRQRQDFAGRSPQGWPRPCTPVFNANQDPALVKVFSTYAANVPQLFLDIAHDKAEALGVPVAEIFPVIQAGFGSPRVHLVHWLVPDRRRILDGDKNVSESARTRGASGNPRWPKSAATACPPASWTP